MYLDMNSKFGEHDLKKSTMLTREYIPHAISPYIDNILGNKRIYSLNLTKRISHPLWKVYFVQ